MTPRPSSTTCVRATTIRSAPFLTVDPLADKGNDLPVRHADRSTATIRRANRTHRVHDVADVPRRSLAVVAVRVVFRNTDHRRGSRRRVPESGASCAAGSGGPGGRGPGSYGSGNGAIAVVRDKGCKFSQAGLAIARTALGVVATGVQE